MFGKRGKYELPFYEDPKAYRNAGIMSLAGCALMVAATFFHWKALFVKYTETKLSGFSVISSIRRGLEIMVVRDYEGKVIERHFSIHGIFPIVAMAIYIAYIVFMAYVSYKYHIKETDIFDKGHPTFFTKRKKTVRIIMIFISIILLIVMTHTKMFREMSNDIDQLYSNWISMIEMSKDSGVEGSMYMVCFKLLGLGKLSYILGLILYTGSYVFRYVVDTLNESEETEPQVEQEKAPKPIDHASSDEALNEQVDESPSKSS